MNTDPNEAAIADNKHMKARIPETNLQTASHTMASNKLRSVSQSTRIEFIVIKPLCNTGEFRLSGNSRHQWISHTSESHYNDDTTNLRQ